MSENKKSYLVEEDPAGLLVEFIKTTQERDRVAAEFQDRLNEITEKIKTLGSENVFQEYNLIEVNGAFFIVRIPREPVPRIMFFDALLFEKESK